MNISENVYDILSYVGKIVLPALSTFVIALFKIWKPDSELGTAIGATIMAIDTLLNALLAESSKNYYRDKNEVPTLNEHEAE